MKIYCTRQTYKKWDLSKYIGKDVWVKCNHYNDRGVWLGELYVNILEVPNFYGNTTSFYRVRMLPAWQVDDNKNFENDDIEGYIRTLMDRPGIIRKTDIDLVYLHGVEMYSTAEILDKLREYNT